MDYSKLTTEELKRRLKKAGERIDSLKTQGGLWATQGESNICIKELKIRGEFKP